jgi:hypothetical protein
MTQRCGWSEQGPKFGVPDFLSFFVSALGLYVLVQGWVFVPEAVKSADNRGLTITAIAVAASSVLLHVKSLTSMLQRVESQFSAFSIFTIFLGVGDFIGMLVTSLNMSDLLAAYPNVSVSRTLVILCCSLAFFRAIVASIFSCFCGVNYNSDNGNIDLINATVGNFAWPMAVKLFPLQLKDYVAKINHSGHSCWPAVIRSASFLRMFLLIYLNGVSLVASDSGLQSQRLAVVSVVCAVFDFVSASYMWLFWGIWDRIQKANEKGSIHSPLLLETSNAETSQQVLLLDCHDPHTFLLYLKNWWSFYIMSIMDLASLIVSLVNITDIIFLFDGNLRWFLGFLLALFLIRSSFQLFFGLQSIFRIRKLLSDQSSLEEWKNFSPPTNPKETLKLEFMYLSDCSFNSFVGFITMLFCPAALVRFFLHGFQSINKRKPKAKSIGLLNLITVVKSLINIVVCFISFVHLELPLVQVVVLTASLILSLWRGALSLSGFLLHTALPKQISLKMTSLLWTASFAAVASILASIVSQPCSFAPELCQTDAVQCLSQNCDASAICHANPSNAFTCACPPWLTGNGTEPCECPSSYFSLPHFERKTCVNPLVFMSVGDVTSVFSFALCLLLASLVWFYEWKHLKEGFNSVNFKATCCMMIASFAIVAVSYGIFSYQHPTSPNCPSWMIASGASCACPLTDYKVPDFEREVCVTSKSHMSQGQVVGVVIGVCVCVAAVILFAIMVYKDHSMDDCLNCCNTKPAMVGFAVCLVILFALVFGIGSSKFFPVPKAACGTNITSYKLCNLNAQCLGEACVCDSGFFGDGTICTVVPTTSAATTAAPTTAAPTTAAPTTAAPTTAAPTTAAPTTAAPTTAAPTTAAPTTAAPTTAAPTTAAPTTAAPPIPSTTPQPPSTPTPPPTPNVAPPSDNAGKVAIASLSQHPYAERVEVSQFLPISNGVRVLIDDLTLPVQKRRLLAGVRSRALS